MVFRTCRCVLSDFRTNLIKVYFLTSGHHWHDPGPAAEPQAAAGQAGEGEKRKQKCRGDSWKLKNNVQKLFNLDDAVNWGRCSAAFCERGHRILFSVVFTPPPPHSHHGSVWLLSVISLLLNNTVSRVRTCLSIWLKRFHGNQTKTTVGFLLLIPRWTMLMLFAVVIVLFSCMFKPAWNSKVITAWGLPKLELRGMSTVVFARFLTRHPEGGTRPLQDLEC